MSNISEGRTIDNQSLQQLVDGLNTLGEKSDLPLDKFSRCATLVVGELVRESPVNTFTINPGALKLDVDKMHLPEGKKLILQI